MQNSSDFYIAKFLVSAGCLKVCDLAHAADIASAGNISLATALLKANYVQPRQFSLASYAVKAMEQSTVGPQVAQVLFQTAWQRGITFEQALSEVEPKRVGSVSDFVNAAPKARETKDSAPVQAIKSGASPRNTFQRILSRRRAFLAS